MNNSKKSSGKNAQDLSDYLVSVRRVSKTAKGGSRLSFSVLVLVGDKAGKIGVATANDKELNEARNKALKMARRNMFHVHLRAGRTLHHDIVGRYCSSKIVMRVAKPGTGIIAGGAARSVCECVGLRDVNVKALRSTNPYNLVRATVNALKSISAPKTIAERRGIKVGSLLVRRHI